MSQTILTSVQARFNTMEIIPIDTMIHQTDKSSVISEQYYPRQGLFYYVKQKIISMVNSFQLQQSDLIVENYFVFALNPLYSKVSELSKKIFVCGYCKQPFFTPAQYLKHCYLEDCPINHPRCSYFFKMKNTSKAIQNQDLNTILTKTELISLLKTSYCRDYLFFSHYEILHRNQTKQNDPPTDLCPICEKIIPHKLKIKYHVVLECPARLCPQAKKLFKVIYCNQSSEIFVQEIINFYLNYNILALTQENSFLKIVQNPQNLSKQKFYCSNCMITFSQENCFLTHLIFTCPSKNGNFQYSSHYLRLHNLPKHKRMNKYLVINESGILQNLLKGDPSNPKLVTVWQEKINQRYSHLKEILQGVYFCGQCLNHFSTSQLYLGHCIRYKCTLNHPKSSHQFLSLKDQRPLKIQNISKQHLQDAIKRIIYDPQLLKKMKFRIIKKAIGSHILPCDKKSYYACGNCQRGSFTKDKLLEHVFLICHSEDHEKTSHTFELQNYHLTDQEYESLIFKDFYCRKIAELSFGHMYMLCKNEKIRFEENYGCGSCETIFESVEEYVYHSITVCQSLQNLKSSHFIKKLYNPAADLLNPFLNLIEESDNNFDSLRKNSRKVKPRTERQIKPRVTQQTQNQLEQTDGRRDLQIRQNFQQERQNHIEEQIQADIVELGQSHEDLRHNNIITSQLNSSRNQIPQNSQSEVSNVFPRRFLQFNIDCDLRSNTKFYCGLCNQSFKDNKKFIKHLYEICSAFQHPKSSHFFISGQRINEINNKTIFNRKMFDKIVFPEEYSVYQLQKNAKFFCACGQEDTVSNISYHRKYHNNTEIKKQQITILNIKLTSQSKKFSFVFLPAFIQNENLTHEFVCPCKPWKKLSFKAFSKHLIKRHAGNTPKFHMKIPEDKIK